MKILLISYHYPPDRAVGGQRARKVVETLRTAGHEVNVIAAGEGGVAGERGDDQVGGTLPYRVAPLPSVRDVYAALRARRGRPAAEIRTDDPATASTATVSTPFWKRWIFSLIWLPDDRQGFVPPAVRRALRLPDGRPDLIYTTAPPFSSHLAGLLVKVLTGAPWAAEFRDPWTANPWKPAEMRSAFSEWTERRLERLCLDSADLLVAVTEGIAGRIQDTGTRTPTLVVRNGIEHLRPENAVTPGEPDSPFEIVYAGSFYHTRNPFPFLDAVRRLVTDRSLGERDLRVRFIGATDGYEGRSVGRYLGEAGLVEHVRLEGWLEPGRALDGIRSADALLLLALDQPDQVPNKLYEYLGARRPILAVADEDGESARMLRRAGGHEIVPANDAALIGRALGRLLDAGRRGPVGDARVLEEWTTSAQMGTLPGALEALADDGSAGKDVE